MAKKRSALRGQTRKDPTDEFFANGEPSEGFSHVPTGTYEGFIIEGSTRIRKKTSGKPGKVAILLIEIDRGEHEGSKEIAKYDLTSQDGINIFLRNLKNMGLGQPKDTREAAACLEEAEGMRVLFWIGVPKDEFPPNVSINEKLSEGDVENGDGGPDDLTADDVSAFLDTDDEGEAELRAIIKDFDLEIDPDDYATWKEVADLVIEQIGLE